MRHVSSLCLGEPLRRPCSVASGRLHRCHLIHRRFPGRCTYAVVAGGQSTDFQSLRWPSLLNWTAILRNTRTTRVPGVDSVHTASFDTVASCLRLLPFPADCENASSFGRTHPMTFFRWAPLDYPPSLFPNEALPKRGLRIDTITRTPAILPVVGLHQASHATSCFGRAPSDAAARALALTPGPASQTESHAPDGAARRSFAAVRKALRFSKEAL